MILSMSKVTSRCSMICSSGKLNTQRERERGAESQTKLCNSSLLFFNAQIILRDSQWWKKYSFTWAIVSIPQCKNTPLQANVTEANTHTDHQLNVLQYERERSSCHMYCWCIITTDGFMCKVNVHVLKVDFISHGASYFTSWSQELCTCSSAAAVRCACWSRGIK